MMSVVRIMHAHHFDVIVVKIAACQIASNCVI